MTSQKSPWREAAIYQIYPWTFNEDKVREQKGHGSLNGIIERIDYLKSLGVDAIWLSPFYDSPMIDGGYDIRDYVKVHSDFGTLDDFAKLIYECHQRGIRVMVDYIPNHSSDQHEWFKKSRHRERGFEDWYIWHPGKIDEHGNRTPPNNWASVFSVSNRVDREQGKMPWLKDGDWTPYKSAWTYDEVRGEYYLHSFATQQPDLNWSNVFVREAMKEVLRFWIRKGVDGFRVDAINYIGKNMDLPDEEVNKDYTEDAYRNPFDQLHRYNASGYPEALHRYVWELCQVLKEDEFHGRDLRMILEAYMGESELYKLDTVAPEVATTFNFGAMSLDWSAHHHKVQTDYYYKRLVPTAVGNQVNGNHDRPRLASRLGDQKARAAAVLNLCLPGMRFIYNGEELGMHNANVPDEKILDRHEFRDGERTPIVWDDMLPNAGFSNAHPDKLWLPVNQDDVHIAANVQRNDPQSSLSLYSHILRICKQSHALQKGEYVPLDSENENVFIYGRVYENEHVVVLVNFSDAEQYAGVEVLTGNNWKPLLSSCVSFRDLPTAVMLSDNEIIKLKPNEALVLQRLND